MPGTREDNRRKLSQVREQLTLANLRSYYRARSRRGFSVAFPPTFERRLGGPLRPTAITDHLPLLYFEAVSHRPRLIVELGTRGGDSTRALLAAAELADAQVLSIDINDCSGADIPAPLRERWTFIRADDVAFAREQFEKWCADRGLEPAAEVIFCDTSHLYEHTKDEIASWLPFLHPRGVMMFHDSSLRPFVRRLDGSVRRAWENERGVIRAIEEALETHYDENTLFADTREGFSIYHVPYSSGFTMLVRTPDENVA